MEGLTLLLGFLVAEQKFFTVELGLVELDPFQTLFSQCNYRCWYFITMEFSHYLTVQESGGYVHPFILDTSNGITPFFLLKLIFFLHGFRENQITTFSCYCRGVLLDPYNTSDYPITIVVIPLINIVVPLLPPYCYYCAP